MGFIKNLIDTVASFGKVLLISGRPSLAGESKHSRLIVMGNGPSLRDTIRDHGQILATSDSLAVNFAANAETFKILRPKLYVLADPHFFATDANGVSSDSNVNALWERIGEVDWDMTLYLPCREKIPTLVKNNSHILIKRYNLTPGEGLKKPVHWLYRCGLAMPRPRNVLIASIMVALREGYRDIAIVGADHTWSRDLWVDDKNRVISVQKHFYKDNEKEFERVAKEYEGYHLHDILNSLTIAFRSYHMISAYAAALDARIVNCTPGSFIDAFPRAPLTPPIDGIDNA